MTSVIETTLPGVLLIEPASFGDARGFFVESYRESWLRDAGVDAGFVQDNHSRSRRGVLRGLHYQFRHPQGKLVRVSRGAVYDVAVDIRPGSPHLGRWFGTVLDDVSHRQLWIPPGFAHGFCVLSDEADFAYKCTAYYDPSSDAGVLWDDPDIGIEWPALDVPFALSDKDLRQPRLRDLTPASPDLHGAPR
ncbi:MULTISPECIES: dTDP-4-dehydrorhamnose 3,5-epimerase [Burkholderia cepacia complex]|uniref:dTDP-4-dehydrorhamnose 3,5-epimerase n=1 Tax=Burkholderia cepacia complex TaxID=87882 RepID=UPI00064BA727|nr:MULTISPECIES: dTDP-4-dehydrorhamnose 3,5-epimerase [Burkholderia cepacia complex]AKM04790.1 dTDP-4-dehydrorhamnose 3,5-epimerase [Burkholderia pyrrocinia]GAU07054.1 DTDP-4-dehydrorhamnose 3,5-epimerase [Burkholderia stabilis]